MIKKLFLIIIVTSWITVLAAVIIRPDIIVGLGHCIKSENLVADYGFGLLWALVLGLSIFIWPVPKQDKRMIFNAWAVKALVALSFMLFYESYYTFLDSYSYFANSRLPFTWDMLKLDGDTFCKGTDYFRLLACVHNKILPDSFHAMKISFAMVGLIGIYIYYKAFLLYLGKGNSKVFYLLSFWPSILFWSSILGKDPVVLLGVAIYVYGVIGYVKKGKIPYLIMIALGIVIAAYIRIWMSVILLTPLLLFLIRKIRGVKTKILFICFIIVMSILVFRTASDYLHLGSPRAMQTQYSKIIATFAEGGGSSRKLDIDFTDSSDIVRFIPAGVFFALFRPLPGEYWNIYGVLSGLDGLAICLLFIRAVTRTRLRDLVEPIIQWAIALVLIWAVVYSGICYKNAGTAVRYRLQVLPLFVALLAYLGRRRVRNFKSADDLSMQERL